MTYLQCLHKLTNFIHSLPRQPIPVAMDPGPWLVTGQIEVPRYVQLKLIQLKLAIIMPDTKPLRRAQNHRYLCWTVVLGTVL